MNEKIREAIKAIKEKLGLDLGPAVEINSWCGDTESGFYTEYDIDMDALNVEIDRFQAELAARATPAKPVGYVLFTGHGDKFSREKPKCEIDYWKPVYLESSQPSPSSVGAAIRALPLPYVKVPPNGARTQWGREMANCGAEVMREHIIALLPKLLFEAAAITKQVQQWVSVSDKMPPVGQEVIVYRPSDKYRKIDFDTWEEQYEAPLSEYPNNQIPIGLGWNENEFEEVTHWMSTPLAPIAHSE